MHFMLNAHVKGMPERYCKTIVLAIIKASSYVKYTTYM